MAWARTAASRAKARLALLCPLRGGELLRDQRARRNHEGKETRDAPWPAAGAGRGGTRARAVATATPVRRRGGVRAHPMPRVAAGGRRMPLGFGALRGRNGGRRGGAQGAPFAGGVYGTGFSRQVPAGLGCPGAGTGPLASAGCLCKQGTPCRHPQGFSPHRGALRACRSRGLGRAWAAPGCPPSPALKKTTASCAPAR